MRRMGLLGDIVYFLVLVLNWVRELHVGHLLKFAAWAFFVLLGSVCISLVTTEGGLHAHPNNINCAIQCIKNPLTQSIPRIIEEKTSCLAEKVQLEVALSSHKEDLEDLQNSFTTQTKELAKMKEEKDNATRERDRLTTNLTSTTKEKDETLEQKSSCLTEKGRLQDSLTSCKQDSADLKSQLDDATNKSKTLATYIEHLKLLEVIYNHTRELETCRVWLKEYCALKNRSDSLNEFETYEMNNFADWLGCTDPLPNASHYDNILPTFVKRVKSILAVREKLKNMLIKGDFTAMKTAQEAVKNLPSEKCQFLCSYAEEEENEESDGGDETSSSFSAKAFEAAWNMFIRLVESASG